MKALIVAGGEKISEGILKKEASQADFIIGADRGCEYLFEYGIFPQYIVGDFDSSKHEIIDSLVKCGAKKYQYNCEKDSTDSDIALELAIKLGAREVTIASVTGTRLDHTFANFGLLKKARMKDVKATIINNTNKMYIVTENTKINKIEDYKYVSFLAYSNKVENLNIHGAKYCLENYDLEIGDNRTVSNEFKDGDIDISFESGVILVIHSRD